NDDSQAPYNKPPMQITTSADRMRAADKDTLQHCKSFVDIDGAGHFNSLEFDGIAGNGDGYIRYKPDDAGNDVFTMQAEDAGATLRALGVYENIVGGTLDITGEPIMGVNDRSIKGLGQIKDFKVVHAPTLARLLGMLSLPGVLGVLND